VLALERLRGIRVVANPAALEAARWVGGSLPVTVIRFAADDAFALGAQRVEVRDEHAIVEDEIGYVGAWLSPSELADLVVPRLEWPLPVERPALAQGLVAGVPAKLWIGADGGALLITAAAFGEELAGRLR